MADALDPERTPQSRRWLSRGAADAVAPAVVPAVVPIVATAVVAVLLTLTGCAPRTLLTTAVADDLATKGQAEEEDLLLAPEAAAFDLKLSESVLRQNPGHSALAGAVAGGFTQYAYAFVACDAERLEATDVRAALRRRQRAAHLYERAHHHAMAALEQQQPGLARALAAPASLSALAPVPVPVPRCCAWHRSRWGWNAGARRHRAAADAVHGLAGLGVGALRMDCTNVLDQP